MRKIRLWLGAFLLAVVSGSASAQANYTNVVMSTTGPENAITAVQTGMESILNKLGPAVLAVVVAGVAIWAIPRIVGLLKSAFSSGKGR